MSHKLLLADDSVTIQRVIELTFADEDVDVVAVGDGAQAIERITNDPPDIVLADTGMPERDGYEVAEFVKSDPSRRHIPVVLLTGAFEPVDEARAESIGCNGVLVKPFEPQQVVAKVRELLAAPVAAVAFEAGSEAAAADISSDEEGDLESFVKSVQAKSETPSPPVAPPAAATTPEMSNSTPAPSMSEPQRSRVSPAPVAPVPVPVPPVRATLPPVVPAPQTSAPARSVKAARSVIPVPPSLPDGEHTVLAQAFSTFLAAEQGTPRPAAPTPLAASRGLELTDQVIDEVVSRVVERLTDRVLRETTTEIVSRVAEQLVREELDRIKGQAS